MHDAAPHSRAIHPDDILPPSFWHPVLALMSVRDTSTSRWDACLDRIWLTSSSGGRDGTDLTPSYRKSPPSKHHSGACLFPQLLSSCYCNFLATFIFACFPMSYFQPFLGFLKGVLLHHCCHQAWCVWPKADMRIKAGAQDLPVGAGRGLLAALRCPWQQAVLQLNTCSQPITNSWCQNRQNNPANPTTN